MALVESWSWSSDVGSSVVVAEVRPFGSGLVPSCGGFRRPSSSSLTMNFALGGENSRVSVLRDVAAVGTGVVGGPVVLGRSVGGGGGVAMRVGVERVAWLVSSEAMEGGEGVSLLDC